MAKNKMLDYRKVYTLKGKIAASTLGIVIISLGIALCRMGNVGVDPFTAMNMGLSELFGIGFGISCPSWMRQVIARHPDHVVIAVLHAGESTGPVFLNWGDDEDEQ